MRTFYPLLQGTIKSIILNINFFFLNFVIETLKANHPKLHIFRGHPQFIEQFILRLSRFNTWSFWTYLPLFAVRIDFKFKLYLTTTVILLKSENFKNVLRAKEYLLLLAWVRIFANICKASYYLWKFFNTRNSYD